MVVTIANMLEAIRHYGGGGYSFKPRRLGKKDAQRLARSFLRNASELERFLREDIRWMKDRPRPSDNKLLRADC